jgi:putative acetyltransferase
MLLRDFRITGSASEAENRLSEITFTRTFADDPVARQLIAELDAGFLKWYSPEHMFGLHPNEERDPALHFFLIHDGDQVVGCGAVRVLDRNTGELKRMYVREAFRGRGISRKLIDHLETTARTLGITCMRLETGPQQVEALGLYESCGYKYIPPYGEYVGSPVSVCMEKEL